MTVRQLIRRLEEIERNRPENGDLHVAPMHEGALFLVMSVNVSSLHGGMVMLQSKPYDEVISLDKPISQWNGSDAFSRDLPKTRAVRVGDVPEADDDDDYDEALPF